MWVYSMICGFHCAGLHPIHILGKIVIFLLEEQGVGERNDNYPLSLKQYIELYRESRRCKQRAHKNERANAASNALCFTRQTSGTNFQRLVKGRTNYLPCSGTARLPGLDFEPIILPNPRGFDRLGQALRKRGG